jgi:prevent-host-death family protein
MKEATVAELRKHTKAYLDAVEDGEVVRLYRRGKPIAEIVPLRSGEPAWKREVPRISISGLSLAREILKDRADAEP